MLNSEGHKLDEMAGSFFCRTLGVAEAYAILAAVRMASREGEPIIIKSDCLEVINTLNTQRLDWPWEYEAIVADIKDLLQRHPMISVTYCRRAEVRIAHNVANLARLGRLMPNWLFDL
ncbi:hypothetical protein LINPERHAP2_LOCUS19438 [Linum perenne]